MAKSSFIGGVIVAATRSPSPGEARRPAQSRGLARRPAWSPEPGSSCSTLSRQAASSSSVLVSCEERGSLRPSWPECQEKLRAS